MADVALVAIKVLAPIFSLGMIYNPSLDMVSVVKSQSTGEMALLPLVSLWISSHLWVVYGLLTSDLFPLFATHINGEICGIVYTAIFYRYTAEKAYARKVILSVFAFFIVVTGYIIVAKVGVTGQSAHSVEQIAGYITAIMDIALFTSPLETIAHVLKTKSGASIPVLMCLCGAVGNMLWVIYGILADNIFVLVPCVFCTLLATLQIVLYFVFNPKKAAHKSDSVDGTHAAKSDLQISISPLVAAGEDIKQIDVKVLQNYDAMRSPRRL
ncbi:Bidirectional sugar transporter sweet15, partial [Globisporangium splendens]